MPYPFRDLRNALSTLPDVAMWRVRKGYETKAILVTHTGTADDTSPEDLNKAAHAEGLPRLRAHYLVGLGGAQWKCNSKLDVTLPDRADTILVALIGDRDRVPPQFDQYQSAVELCARLLRDPGIFLLIKRIVTEGQYLPLDRFVGDVAAAVGRAPM